MIIPLTNEIAVNLDRITLVKKEVTVQNLHASNQDKEFLAKLYFLKPIENYIEEFSFETEERRDRFISKIIKYKNNQAVIPRNLEKGNYALKEMIE